MTDQVHDFLAILLHDEHYQSSSTFSDNGYRVAVHVKISPDIGKNDFFFFFFLERGKNGEKVGNFFFVTKIFGEY